MSSSVAPSFVLQNVNFISEKQLDSLPYGVIQLDHVGTVLLYNSYEAELAGLTKRKVVGKNFFKQVAPCTDIRDFYGRFQAGVAAVNCTALSAFTLPLRHNLATLPSRFSTTIATKPYGSWCSPLS